IGGMCSHQGRPTWWCPRRAPNRSSRTEHAAPDLIFLDRFKQGLEVALAEAVVTLALDELEEDRPDHRLGEDLQQDASRSAVHDPFAVDQDPMLLHATDRLVVVFHAPM